jgi:hypothetical protein
MPLPASLLGGGGGNEQNPAEPDAKNYGNMSSDEVAEDLGSVGGLSDLFFNWYANDGTDFRSIFAYQFVITNAGQYVNHISLPLNPSNISMSLNPAISATVTMKGINEDNNGAPLRPINVSGTTGVWNNVLGSAFNKTQSSTLDYLFKNTIQAAEGVAAAANKTIAAFSGSQRTDQGPLNYSDFGQNNIQAQGSGYFFFHNLVNFFDSYVAKKKTRDGANYRLTFQMHKDKMYYDVLLTGFNWQKKPGTLEYEYSINLTAYRRRKTPVVGDHLSQFSNQTTQASSLSTLASIINGVRKTRVLLAKSADVLRGIRSDAEDSFFNPMREVILAGSDIAGVLTTLADMPQAIINSAKAAFESAMSDNTGAAANLRRTVDSALKYKFGLRGDPAIPGSSALTSKITVQAADGKANFAVRAETAFPSEIIFADPTKYAAIFDQVSPNSMSLPPAVRDQVNAEVTRVRELSVPDFQSRRDKMQLFAASISDALGGGSSTYNSYLGIPSASRTFKKLSTDDVELISQINDVIMSIDKLIVNIQQAAPDTSNDYYQFYGDYAVSQGLNFVKGTSKFFVPFPPGSSLEQLAARYLGDPNRWIEIAAVNGLKEPYVDEEGFVVPLLANSSESSVQIADVTKLFVGQVVTIQSKTKVGVMRKITSIERIAESQYLVFFDGPSTLVGFRVRDGAEVFSYLPDTVNGTKLIAIPSPSPVNVPGKIQLTPGAEDLNGLAIIAKTDFLLQTDGQMVLQGNGDVQLATGMTNLTQAGLILLNTPQGALLNDLTYGNPISSGMSSADVNVQAYLRSLNSQFLQDPRFLGVLAGTVNFNGVAASTDILVGVRGMRLNLPITAGLPL